MIFGVLSAVISEVRESSSPGASWVFTETLFPDPLDLA